MAQKQAKESIPTAVVVNDDVPQLKVLSRLVLKAGLEPLSFTGAEAALKEMDPENPPALIVTDLHMPGLDAWRFCRLLRSPEYEAFNQVPILVVSATFAGEEPKRIADELGVEGFIPSPVDGKSFVRQIKAILRGEIKRVVPRVLIIVDGKVLAGALKKVFVSEGYRVDVAYSVQEATAAFAKARYDVAVIDYHLPDGTGDGLLDLFRSSRPDCACLMMTTNPGADLALDWMKRGAAAYIRKPFDPAYLLELCAKARRECALLRAEDLLEARTLELRESEEKHRRLFETMAQGVIYQASDGAIISANPAAERILGLSFDRMRGKTSMDARWRMIREDGSPVPGAEHPAMIALRTGGTIGPVVRGVFHPEKDAHIWLSITAMPLFQAGKTEPFQVYSTFEEITERKQAEESLRLRESLLQRIFEILPVGLWFADRNGKLLKGNPAGVKIWGAEPLVDPSEYGVFKARRLPSGEELDPGDWALAHTIRDGVTIVDELLEIDSFDGKKKIILNYTAPVTGENGEIEGAIVVNQDITELERLHVQLNQAQKMESVGRLAGGVAHDFNNMLAIILGRTDLALTHVDTAQPVRSDLLEIRKAADRSADLVRQILAFARKQTIQPKVLDLNDTVEKMLKMLRRLIGEDIDLAWLPGKNLWPVNMDPSQLDQILANLCVNARDAIDGVGKVTLETGNVTLDENYRAGRPGFEPGGYVLLAVSDDGCGMAKEIKEKLFEPFFTTKELGKGTGLGLPTVYGIVKQNNGFVNVYSEPGRGTTFRIYIPGHIGEAEKEQGRASDKRITGGNETILLVEDDPMLLQMGKDMLEKLGYRVLAAGSPSEALRIAAEHKENIRLLITDVVMPGMNGRELADQLSAAYPDMKLIFISGYTADVIAHHGVLDFGVKFVQKPFSMKDLANRIREALESRIGESGRDT